jgi:hypothetical protein
LGLARTQSQKVLSSRIKFCNGLRNNSASNVKLPISAIETANTQIMSANIKNDMLNPFRPLNSREIEKINMRIVGLKEKIFLKDKHI